MEPNQRKRTPPTHENLSIFFQMTIWHWIISISALIATVIEALIPHSFGTVIAHFKSQNSTFKTKNDETFKLASQFQLDWLPVLSSALPCILLPIFTVFVTRYNRFYQVTALGGFLIISLSCLVSSLVETWYMLFLTYSIVYSIGASLLLAVVITILAEYFPVEHRFHVFATSLYQCGYALGAIIGNPSIALMIKLYDWRKTFKYLAIVQCMSGLFISLFLKPFRSKDICFKIHDSGEESEISYINKDTATESSTYLDDTTNSITSIGSVAVRVECWLWLIAKWLNYMCWYGLRTNVASYLVTVNGGMSLSEAASMMVYYAAAEIVIAILASAFGDKLRGHLVFVHLVSSICIATLCATYPIAVVQRWAAILMMILIGLFVQLTLSFGYPASVEVMNCRYNMGNIDEIIDMRQAWVLTNVAAGLGIITSPLISGLMMDKVGLKVLFWTLATCWTLQTFLYISVLLTIKIIDLRNNSDYHSFPSKNKK